MQVLSSFRCLTFDETVRMRYKAIAKILDNEPVGLFAIYKRSCQCEGDGHTHTDAADSQKTSTIKWKLAKSGYKHIKHEQINNYYNLLLVCSTAHMN